MDVFIRKNKKNYNGAYGDKKFELMLTRRAKAYKVACKKISWSGQRETGGTSHRAPLNTPLISPFVILKYQHYFLMLNSCDKHAAQRKRVFQPKTKGITLTYFCKTTRLPKQCNIHLGIHKFAASTLENAFR